MYRPVTGSGKSRQGHRPEPAEAGEGPPLLGVGRPAFALDPLQDADGVEELPGLPHLAGRHRPRRDGGQAVGLAASGGRDGRRLRCGDVASGPVVARRGSGRGRRSAEREERLVGGASAGAGSRVVPRLRGPRVRLVVRRPASRVVGLSGPSRESGLVELRTREQAALDVASVLLLLG